MIITRQWLIDNRACPEAVDEFSTQVVVDSDALLRFFLHKNTEKYLSWGNWLVTKLLTHKQCVEYAVYAAELVLPVYERGYPDDARVGNAINAAKRYLNTADADAGAACVAAYVAAYVAGAAAATACVAAYVAGAAAATAAADAAYAAGAADASAAYAGAAYASAGGVYAAGAGAAAAAAYAYAAYAAAAIADTKIRSKILKYGISLLNTHTITEQ